MSTITVRINDLTVSGKTGMTILDLAHDLGIPIPTLCHDPHLSPAGACRICLVEEETRGVLLPSCVTAITPGMVIRTDSLKVLENRKIILQLLLAEHPESCIVCDKGNRCRLRALAADLGVGPIPLDSMPHYVPTLDNNPFFKRDLSKCILCGKCIRGDQELVMEGVLDYSHRGFEARPATFGHLPLEEAGCTFCGTCLSLCPTGALSETGLFHQGTISEKTVSVCSHCACGCLLSLETVSNRIIRITPVDEGPRDPALCLKGHFGFNYFHNSERLTKPLMRKNGNLEEISWEEALATLIQSFRTIQKDSGTNSIGCIAGPHLTNEELYLFQKMARLGFKTPHVDNGGALSGDAVLPPLEKTLGLAFAFPPLENILNSDLILVIGADPTETAPVLGYHLKKALTQHSAKLILIDPRKTKLALKADLWLRTRPGTDLSLINSLIQTILTENLWNERFVLSRTEGFSEWRDFFLKQDMKAGLAATGLEESLIQEAARSLAASKRLIIIFGDGLNQYSLDAAAFTALFNLLLLLGQPELSGSGIYPLLKECNAFGAWEMGVLPNRLPGYQSASDPSVLKPFLDKWGTPVPPGPGLSALEMIEAARKGTLKGLYLASEDPLGSYPDRAWVAEALGQLEFLVVQDLFLTDTARMAHLVLPSAGLAEKKGTCINLDRRIQRARQAISPPGQAKADGEIFSMILKAEAGWNQATPTDDVDLTPFSDPDWSEKTFAEIKEMVPGYEKINFEGSDQPSSFLLPMGPGSKTFRFEIPIRPLDAKAPDPDYPFVLITGRLLPHLGSGARTWKDPRLAAITPSPRVTLSPKDAQALGIHPGDRVQIQSRKGAISVSARIGDEVSAGFIFLPLPYPELKINNLFDVQREPISQGSWHKHCPVRIFKV